MLTRFPKRRSRDERGITGLETAIILIAFVVVAAVFAYTALSAGLFSTQKSQEAVHSGLEEAQSTLELKGGVIAEGAAAGHTDVTSLSIMVAIVAGGEPIDFTAPASNVVVISYIDANQRSDDVSWTATKNLGSADNDVLLEDNEVFLIVVDTSGLTTDLGTNTTFSLEVKPPKGASLIIERTTPAYLNKVENLN